MVSVLHHMKTQKYAMFGMFAFKQVTNAILFFVINGFSHLLSNACFVQLTKIAPWGVPAAIAGDNHLIKTLHNNTDANILIYSIVFVYNIGGWMIYPALRDSFRESWGLPLAKEPVYNRTKYKLEELDKTPEIVK